MDVNFGIFACTIIVAVLALVWSSKRKQRLARVAICQDGVESAGTVVRSVLSTRAAAALTAMRRGKRATVVSQQVDAPLAALLALLLKHHLPGPQINELCRVKASAATRIHDLDPLLSDLFWALVTNLGERLSAIDVVSFLTNDVTVCVLTQLRVLKQSEANNVTMPYRSYLATRKSEEDHVKLIVESLLYTICPANVICSRPVVTLLRELLATNVLLPVVDLVCDPDWINQLIVRQLQPAIDLLEGDVASGGAHIDGSVIKKPYEYAEDYEGFLKLIATMDNVHDLQQMRYHIIAEIMQGSLVESMKLTSFANESVALTMINLHGAKLHKLQSRNIERYISQLQYAKTQCEKRIKQFGGPDYAASTSFDKPPDAEKPLRPARSTALRLAEIVHHPVAITYFMNFLTREGAKSLLQFWLSCESFKTAYPPGGNDAALKEDVKELCARFLKNDSIHLAIIPASIRASLKDYSNDLCDRKKFNEAVVKAQSYVFNHLDTEYYKRFVLSDLYITFVCDEEKRREDDDFSKQQKKRISVDSISIKREGSISSKATYSRGSMGSYDGQSLSHSERTNTTIDESADEGQDDGDDDDDVQLFAEDLEIQDPTAPAPPEETTNHGNNYIRQRIQDISEQLEKKEAQLHELQLAGEEFFKPPPELEAEIKAVEDAVASMMNEQKQLQHHAELTENWWASIDKWQVVMHSVDITEDPVTKQMITTFAMMVSRAGVVAMGWVLIRKYSEFVMFHKELRDISRGFHDIKLPPKPTSKTLESSRVAYEQYLSEVMADDILRMSEAVYLFLTPRLSQTDYGIGKRQPTSSSASEIEGDKSALDGVLRSLRRAFSVSSIPSSTAKPTNNLIQEDYEFIGDELNMETRRDELVEPLYKLVAEIFELQGVFRWLRRQMIVFVQITFGGTLHRNLLDTCQWLVSSPQLIYYLNTMMASLWPEGNLPTAAPSRSSEEKDQTRAEAHARLLRCFPTVLQSVLGKVNTRRGIERVFSMLQDEQLNRHFIYSILDMFILHLIPELIAEEEDDQS